MVCTDIGEELRRVERCRDESEREDWISSKNKVFAHFILGCMPDSTPLLSTISAVRQRSAEAREGRWRIRELEERT